MFHHSAALAATAAAAAPETPRQIYLQYVYMNKYMLHTTP